MSAAEPEDRHFVAPLLSADPRAHQERRDTLEQFWVRVVAADRRVARIRDNPEAKAEVEALLSQWERALGDTVWYPERSKEDLEALSRRMEQVHEELCELMGEAMAIGRVTEGGPLDHHVGDLFLHLLATLEAIDPAVAAAKQLAAMPAKRGGPGKYTASLRPKPIEQFGAGIVPIFRAAGISLGGNVDRDRGFELFLEIAADFVTGADIPGKGALLASLRKL